ncbi:hypothetical protein IQ07DRAFT_635285 [Pyrenochaeta sp. DS3sAY3a]|nr:hypothetical protein IQ07DRAFT_635285 [Pyrenochaeta sp. DS3sAY3a]
MWHPTYYDRRTVAGIVVTFKLSRKCSFCHRHQDHQNYIKQPDYDTFDSNLHALGRIASHNVVLPPIPTAWRNGAIWLQDRWKYEQSVGDVENQLAGVEFYGDAVPAVTAINAMGPEQKELVEAAHASPEETPEAVTGHRIRAISMIISDCGEGEVLPSRAKQSHDCVVPSGKGRKDY